MSIRMLEGGRDPRGGVGPGRRGIIRRIKDGGGGLDEKGYEVHGNKESG